MSVVWAASFLGCLWSASSPEALAQAASGIAHAVALSSVGYLNGRPFDPGTLPKALRKVPKAVIRVEAFDQRTGKPVGGCTGTIVDNCVLTSGHCFRQTRKNPLIVKFFDKNGRVLQEMQRFSRFDDDVDLMLIKPKGKFADGLSLSRGDIASAEPPAGKTPVYGFGFGSTGHYVYSSADPIPGTAREYKANFAVWVKEGEKDLPQQFAEMSLAEATTDAIGHRILHFAPKVSDVFSPDYRMPFYGDSGGPGFDGEGRLVGVCKNVSTVGPNLRPQEGELTEDVKRKLDLDLGQLERRFKFTRYSIPILHRAEFLSTPAVRDEIHAVLDKLKCEAI